MHEVEEGMSHDYRVNCSPVTANQRVVVSISMTEKISSSVPSVGRGRGRAAAVLAVDRSRLPAGQSIVRMAILPPPCCPCHVMHPPLWQVWLVPLDPCLHG